MHRLRACGVLLALTALMAACQRPPSSSGSRSNSPRAALTFNNDIAPLLYKHCATCHRPDPSSVNDVSNRAEPWCIAGAPFSLLTYQDASSHGRQIAAATKRRSMPPWLPEPGYGRFVDERRLTDDEIEMIQEWVAQGAAEGDASSRPPIPKWSSGWQLGEPDLVLTLPQPYTLGPGGTDAFRNFVLPVRLPATKYVQAVEFRADNPRILHHASVGVDRMRMTRKLDQADPDVGFAVMPDNDVQNVFGWSPGKAPATEPAGLAWSLDKGSDLVVQLHLLPDGKPEIIRPSVGLFFSEVPPTRTSVFVKLESKTIDIAPGQSEYSVDDHYVLPADVEVLSVYPHAHYLAKTIKAFATLPDGAVKWLIWIKNWNFRRQDEYRYAESLLLPKGTTLTMQVTYDNSAENASNPNRPPQRVTWGPHSSEEMGVVWLKMLPVHDADTGIFMKDYALRTLQADLRAAEMRVRTDPQDGPARNVLATRLLQTGRIPEAVAQLQEALRLKPGDAEAHSNLGSAFLLQGRLAEAIQHLREASRLAPDNDRVHFNLGNAMSASRNVDDATREFRRAIQINPDNADAQFNLAIALGSRGQIGEAIMHLRRTLEINPQNGEAHRNLGVALGRQGKLDEAIEEVREALRIRPESVEARNILDVLLRSKDRKNQP